MFVILGLPRSRTFWLSRFLSYLDWNCGHDQLQYMRSLEDVRSWLSQPCTGTAETAVAPFWRLLKHYAPDTKIVTVRRSVGDVMTSLSWSGIIVSDPVDELIRQQDRKLDQIERRIPGVLSVQFDDLASEAVCAKIFEHCLPYPHDPKWWASWDRQIVSGNITAQTRYASAHLPQLQKLARLARQRELALMRPKGIAPSGFVFEEENDFDVWYRDATPLFREHEALVDENPDQHATKNLPLMRQLFMGGKLQILTARSNGKMFGYHMAVISPTLESPDGVMANLLTHYASKDAPGLGRKLHYATIDLLRHKGVHEIFARAGIRGDGPRLGALYRRSGFRDYGELFRLADEGEISWGS